jgi:hypothetical protein
MVRGSLTRVQPRTRPDPRVHPTRGQLCRFMLSGADAGTDTQLPISTAKGIHW